MTRGIAAAAIALTLACTPPSGGVGSGDTTGGTTSGDSTGGSPATSSPTTPGDTTNATDGGTDDAGTSTGSLPTGDDASDSSSGELPCLGEDVGVLWAEDGVLDFPMELFDSEILGMQIAFSPTAEMGTLALEFETTCEAPLYLWGLVWDYVPGVMPPNPDSYYVTVDDEDEIAWEYGCGTEASDPESWTWVQVQASNDGCDQAPLMPSLPAGSHTIVIRNREAGMGTNIGAIAGVAFSHDPATDPAMFLDPP